MNSTKYILISELTPQMIPRLNEDLSDGSEILVFDFLLLFKSSPEMRSWIESNKSIQWITPRVAFCNHGNSIDKSEEIFSRNSELLDLSERIREIVGVEDSHYFLKRSLTDSLFRTLYLLKIIREISSKNSEAKFEVISSGFFKDVSLLEENVQDVSIHSIGLKIQSANKRFFFLVKVFLFLKSMCLLVTSWLPRKKRKDIESVSLISTSRQLSSKSDDLGIAIAKKGSKEKTLLLSTFNLDSTTKSSITDEGLKILEFTERKKMKMTLLNRVGIGVTLNLVNKALKIMSLQANHPYLDKALLANSKQVLDWVPILGTFSIKNYFYTNIDTQNQLFLNSLLQSFDIKVFYYATFLGGGYLYSKDMEDFKNTRHFLWSFQNMDYFLGFNNYVGDYYKTHYPSKRVNYLPSGCYSSDLIKERYRKDNKNDLLKDNFENYEENKVITFFDTSYIDDPEIFTQFDDGIAFYRDVLKYIETHPQYRFFIKPAKDISAAVDPTKPYSVPEKGKIIQELQEKIKKLPNVNWLGHKGDKLLAIGLSDITITHCLSSPTAEALGAGKKSFWYEPEKKHNETICAGIPGLVEHGYPSLEKRIEDLLGMPEEKFQEYLIKFISGKVVENNEMTVLDTIRKLTES